jgi:hypothetical protein
MAIMQWWQTDPDMVNTPKNWLVAQDTDDSFKLIVGFEQNDNIRPFNGYGPKPIIITEIVSYCIIHDHYEFKDTTLSIFKCYKELYGCNNRSDILKILEDMEILEGTDDIDYTLSGIYNSKQ